MFNSVNNLEARSRETQTWETRQTFKGCCLKNSKDQATIAGWGTLVSFDTELYDIGAEGADFRDGMHTSALACAGTVTKGIGLYALTGVATAFLTELYVGALIFVGTEWNTVVTITSNTVATVYQPWTAAAAGSAFTRCENGAVIPGTGIYQVSYEGYLSAQAGGLGFITRNRMITISYITDIEILHMSAGALVHGSFSYKFTRFDWIQFWVYTAQIAFVAAEIVGNPLSYSPRLDIARVS